MEGIGSLFQIFLKGKHQARYKIDISKTLRKTRNLSKKIILNNMI